MTEDAITRNISLIKPDLPSYDALAGPFREIVESGRITNFGKYVREFEDEAGAYLGTHVATTSSGTMGLLFTLIALGLKPGQKVVLPSFTFMATAQAILLAGGVPLFAECEDDLTLSPSDLANLLAKHDDVAVVMPVHTYGLPAHVDEIQRVVDAAHARTGRAIAILYDAAHGFGTALADGRRVGGFGSAEVFSLSVTKVLVSVEGGMISSRDAGLIGRVRKMRNYGIEDNYNARYAGLNGKLSEFHAVIGLQNLRQLPALLAERQRKARAYLDKIQELTGFEVMAWPPGVMHTFKDLTVLVPAAQTAQRAAVMDYLKLCGVETRAYFSPPVHEQDYFARFADRPLPRTEALSRRVITLPFYTTMTYDEIDYVVKALADAEKALL